MEIEHRILIIDFTDFEDYPIGGYLSLAKNFMESFGPNLALAGITTSKNDPVGRWFKKEINGIVYDFFSMARYKKSKTRHLIPDRLVGFSLLEYFRKQILAIGIHNVFLQRQELLISVAGSDGINICYCFSGLENPLAISKYRYAGIISKWFERIFFNRLRHVRTILASGDDNAINEMVIRSKGKVSKSSVTKFPTRINTDIFKPFNQNEARGKMNLPYTSKILITTGRLASLKGWKFMIDCFMLFEKLISDCRFYFLGEGEDYEKIKDYISHNNLNGKIFLAGKKSTSEIALFLNASDLFIMGSYKEGWSTSLIEAIACGTPACVTNFSSAKEIIVEGINGFVTDEHKEDLFVQAMLKALKIPRPVPNDNVVRFSSKSLKTDLLQYWKLI
jgi:glycosyltransferase involved in cell wall biosynthesis